MVNAIIKEISLSSGYLPDKELDSIYFGGGTPSLLSSNDLDNIFQELSKYYSWSDNTEITLEANPDDVTLQKVKDFSGLGINRWSLGVQSFSDRDLIFMNRAHQNSDSLAAINSIISGGSDNITIDLIYGTPGLSDKDWIAHLQQAFDFRIPHLSCYALTVEEGTALHHFIKTGKNHPLDPEQSRRQFDILMDLTTKEGYLHYEISNFSKPEYQAIHNTNYWKGIPYLGIGPAAHSYDKKSRRWNVANNIKYMKSINEGIIPFEMEVLTERDHYNEYIMTGLRTMWGIDISQIENQFQSTFLSGIQRFLDQGLVIQNDHYYTLSKEGKHLADFISSDLFI